MLHEKTTIDPSQAVANQQVSLEQMRDVMERVLPIFELEGEAFDEAVHQFVAGRVAELSLTDTGKPVGYSYGGTDRFIGPETPMIASGILSHSYFMDDPKAYETSFAYIKQSYSILKNKLPVERAYINSAVQGSNFGQTQYFQSVKGDLDRYMQANADIVSDDRPEQGSIKDFKKIAVCLERAAVTHNTLKIAGIHSRLEGGYISVSNEDGTEESEPHAFITFINVSGDRVLYDPTNPVMVWDAAGNLATISPTHFKIDDPSASQASGTVKERTIIDGKQVESRAREVTYTFKD